MLDENDELKAFLIQFDNGYLTVGLDFNLYEIVTTGENSFLIKSKKHYLTLNILLPLLAFSLTLLFAFLHTKIARISLREVYFTLFLIISGSIAFLFLLL